MDTRTLKELLCAGPNVSLIDAIDDGQDILPLLDVELHRSSSRLQRLKEYRNSLSSSIYRLHPELLSKIFFIYAEHNNELFDLRWTRLLLVCRRWHDIGTHTQRLWSYIRIDTTRGHGRHQATGSLSAANLDAKDVRRIEAQRSHAGLWPLNITMVLLPPLSEAQQAYTSIFWTPDSLASLWVHGDERNVEKLAHILAAHRHTMLKALRMHCISNINARLDTRQPVDAALRSNLPQLQVLSIVGIPFDWTLIQSLRHLSINYVSDISWSFSPQDIIDALGRCPLLNFLFISLPPSYHADTSTRLTAITLPHLSLASLRGNANICTDLLRALTSISRFPKVFVDTTSRRTDTSMISSLATYAGRHALPQGAPIIRSVVISSTSAVPGPVELSGTRLEIVSQRHPTRARVDTPNSLVPVYPHEDPACITLSTIVTSVAAGEVYTSVLQPWPLSRVTHVDLRSADVTVAQLKAVFTELPTASTVIVRPEAGNVLALLGFLEEHLRDHGQRVVANILFDAAQVAMRNLPHIWDGTPRVVVEVRVRRSIMRALHYCSKAARAGVPLDTIEILNDPDVSTHRLIDPTTEIDWSELYGDLQDGFVYEGIMHSSRAEYDGIEKDSFANADIQPKPA